jgi:hypothetical protein
LAAGALAALLLLLALVFSFALTLLFGLIALLPVLVLVLLTLALLLAALVLILVLLFRHSRYSVLVESWELAPVRLAPLRRRMLLAIEFNQKRFAKRGVITHTLRII